MRIQIRTYIDDPDEPLPISKANQKRRKETKRKGIPNKHRKKENLAYFLQLLVMFCRVDWFLVPEWSILVVHCECLPKQLYAISHAGATVFGLYSV